MSYGNTEPKLKESVKAVMKYLEPLFKNVNLTSFITFDHIVDVILEPSVHGSQQIHDSLLQIEGRGLTNIASALQKSTECLESYDYLKEILLVSDGRLNFGLSGGGSEGDNVLISEALEIANKCKDKEITVNAISAGEDSFIGFLKVVTNKTLGKFYHSYELLGEKEIGKPPTSTKMTVHSIPEVMPAGQPTWAKEMNSPHYAIVSEKASNIYTTNRFATLSNVDNQREIRIPLFSINNELLSPFRTKFPLRVREVESEKAILLDVANRKALGLKTGDIAQLNIY